MSENYGFGGLDLAFVFLTMLNKDSFQFAGFLLNVSQSLAGKKSGLAEQFQPVSRFLRAPATILRSLLMKSRLDLARVASRYCVPTEVPDRRQLTP